MMSRFRTHRWGILALISIASLLNYVDRQTLALLAKPVQRDIGIDDVGYANLVTFFLVAYTIGNLVTGWLVSRIGARRALTWFVGIWSIASGLGGLAQTSLQLGLTRFFLGLGEAGNWTAAPVLVRRWFSIENRAVAVGFYSGMAQVGGALAPPLIAVAEAWVGWRGAFLITGAAGILWIIAWMAYYPAAAEREPPVDVNDSSADVDAQSVPSPWVTLLSDLRLWRASIAWAISSPIWFFYLFWFPKYLTDERGMSLAEIGATSWIVYAAAGIGSVTGGIISRRLIRREWTPQKARIAVMALVVALAPIGAVNWSAPPIEISLAIAAFVGLCHFFWITNITALVIDLFPAQDLGRVFGMTGLFSGLAGIGTTYLIAILVGELSYRPMFAVMALLYPAALIVVWPLRRASAADNGFQKDIYVK
jgi:ACS family hexuronate transporter-like MFS transporter